jgi:hypothetical protein
VGCLSNGVERAYFSKTKCAIKFREPGRGRGTSWCRSEDAVVRPDKAEQLVSFKWRPQEDVGWNASPLILLAYEADASSE